MDPVDILGGLLGQKSSGGGIGATILKEIFKGASQGSKASPRSSPAPSSRPASRSPASGAPAPRDVGSGELERQAQELEDLLNVANSRHARRSASTQTSAPTPPGGRAPAAPPTPANIQIDSNGPLYRQQSPAGEQQRQNDQALVLVRAMVNAAKSDGQISQAEQQAILGRFDNPSHETIQFLRDEFNQPLNVREFAWSVPLGMEQQVYSLSLLAIDLDSPREDEYLRELAHGLRMPPELCEQIKARMGVAGAARFAKGR